MGAPARRQAVRALVAEGSRRHVPAQLVGISRSSFALRGPKPKDDVELLERIREIRERKPRWGYKRVCAKLRSEGFAVNHKRIERIWREYGLALSARRRRKSPDRRDRAGAAGYRNHVWTYDFIFDATLRGPHDEGAHRRRRVHARGARHRAGAIAHVGTVKGVLARLFARPGQAGHDPAATTAPSSSPSSSTEWLEAQGSATYHIEPGQALAEQLRRVVQQPPPRRVPEHERVLEHRACPGGARSAGGSSSTPSICTARSAT